MEATTASAVVPPLTDITAFPPLADGHPLSGHSPSSSAHRNRLLWGAVKWCSRRALQHSPLNHQANTTTTRLQTERVTTLVFGDSIVQNVHLNRPLTVSFPGASVTDIAKKICSVLDCKPPVNGVVIHVGTNDTSRQQSELLKRDFIQLINQISQSRLCVFMSGLTPTCGACDCLPLTQHWFSRQF